MNAERRARACPQPVSISLKVNADYCWRGLLLAFIENRNADGQWTWDYFPINFSWQRQVDAFLGGSGKSGNVQSRENIFFSTK